MSVRKLNNKDRKLFLNFLLKKPVQNTYIIGNYFKYGFNSVDVIFYAGVDEHNNIQLVLMNYYKDFVFFTTENLDNVFLDNIKQTIKKKDFRVISGDAFSIEQLYGSLENVVLRKTTMMTMLYRNNLVFDDGEIRILRIDDIYNAICLLQSINEFKPKFDYGVKKRVKRMILEDEIYGYFFEGALVALLSVTAKSPYGCMLTDICVDRKYRGKGFAKKLIIYVSDKLFDQGIKNINLYADNPKAIKLYEILGFKSCGEYFTLGRKYF